MILTFIMDHKCTHTQSLMSMAVSPDMSTKLNITIRRFMVLIITTTQHSTMVTKFTAMSIYIMKILTCTTNLSSPKWPIIMNSQLTSFRKPMLFSLLMSLNQPMLLSQPMLPSQLMLLSQLMWFMKRLFSSL